MAFQIVGGYYCLASSQTPYNNKLTTPKMCRLLVSEYDLSYQFTTFTGLSIQSKGTMLWNPETMTFDSYSQAQMMMMIQCLDQTFDLELSFNAVLAALAAPYLPLSSVGDEKIRIRPGPI